MNKYSDKETLSIEITELMIHDKKKWKRFACSYNIPHVLRLFYDQLFITANDKIIDVFNLQANLNGFCKEKTFVLTSKDDIESKKIRFKILSKKRLDMLMNTLKQYFPVVNKNEGNRYCNVENKKSSFKNINEVLKKVVCNNDMDLITTPSAESKEFVKMCLLDPLFPQYVEETKKTLQAMELLND